MPRIATSASAAALILWAAACQYPYEQRTSLPLSDSLHAVADSPVNIHLRNGSLIVAPKGFTLEADTISVVGTQWDASRLGKTESFFRISLDSVAGIEMVTEVVPPGRVVGGVIFYTSSAAISGFGAVLLFKAIFGSCPTVYTTSDTGDALEAELFSYSIARAFETGDMDVLQAPVPFAGPVRLSLKNEALETHHIDQFVLCAVDHPAGTVAVPADDGSVLIASPLAPPQHVADADGALVTATLAADDRIVYTTPTRRTIRSLPDGTKDYLDAVFAVPPGTDEAVLVLTARNSLENTVLLYNIMMEGQGTHVLAWMDRINSDPFEAWRLYWWYREHSGIDVLVERDGIFLPVGRMSDTGPIAWKTSGARVPVRRGSSTVHIRLRFLPDAWAIDRIALGACVVSDASVATATLRDVSTLVEIEPATVAALLQSADEERLTTYPGERYDLVYELPKPTAATRTLFIRSRGYYIEWIRPDWLQSPRVEVFDISRSDLIRRRLTELWLNRKQSFEREFYATKIPTAPGTP